MSFLLAELFYTGKNKDNWSKAESEKLRVVELCENGSE